MNLNIFLENASYIGGGEYYLLKLAQQLSKNHNVTVHAKSRYDLFEELESENLRFKVRGSLFRSFKGYEYVNKLWEYFHERTILKSHLDSQKPDFVIGYLRDSAVKATRIGKKFNIPVVNFVFESPPWIEKDLGERWKKEFKGKFKKSWMDAEEAYLNSDILIGVSKKCQEEAEKWLDRKLDGYVYPVINMEAADKVKEMKKENQMIYVGRLNEYKNLHEVFYALDKIDKPPLLKIIGDGYHSKQLKKLAKGLGTKVEFMGTVDEDSKFEEIKKSLFMVFPSSHEGFGMPPMEALYCVIPCLCSDKPIFKEVYKDNVEYFKEHDIDELAERIRFLTKKKKYREERGKNGRKFIKRNFSWEKSAGKFENILKKWKKS